MSLRPLNTFHSRHAVVFGMAFAGIKTGFADYLVQKQFEKAESVNWKRVVAFTTFGFFYLGGVQYFVYVPLFTRTLFPNAERFVAKTFRQKLADVEGCKDVVKQVLVDLVIHEPFFYFPCFYVTKEAVMTEMKPGFVVSGIRRWYNNFWDDCKANWSVWGPAFTVNFLFCPMWARVPFTAAVSLGWTCLLSSMRGKEGEDKENSPEKTV